MTELDVRGDKNLWEKAEWNESIGTPCLIVEESYYDGIVEMIDEKNKKIESLEKTSSWKTIEGEMPKNGQRAIVEIEGFIRFYEALGVFETDAEGELCFLEVGVKREIKSIKKWMPIPEREEG